MGMIISMIELTPAPGNRKEILELLQFSVDRLRTKPGCLGCGVYEAGDERETILYLERWASEEELHRHIRSSLYLGVLSAMDLAEGARTISFHEVSETKSLELVVALRGSGVG
jgi:quinol monooxygenase YgiN